MKSTTCESVAAFQFYTICPPETNTYPSTLKMISKKCSMNKPYGFIKGALMLSQHLLWGFPLPKEPFHVQEADSYRPYTYLKETQCNDPLQPT